MEQAFSRRLEELAGEWKENMTAAVADARRAASTEVAAETRSAAAGELAEALEREKRESKRAVEAAVRRKDREMAKALKVGFLVVPCSSYCLCESAVLCGSENGGSLRCTHVLHAVGVGPLTTSSGRNVLDYYLSGLPASVSEILYNELNASLSALQCTHNCLCIFWLFASKTPNYVLYN